MPSSDTNQLYPFDSPRLLDFRTFSDPPGISGGFSQEVPALHLFKGDILDLNAY